MQIDIRKAIVLLGMVFGLLLVQVSVSRADRKEEPEKEEPAHLVKCFANPPDNPDLPNVLIIGDSISMGYTVPVRKLLDGKADVFRPTINCAHSGFGVQYVKWWLGRKNSKGKSKMPTDTWDVIHFNFGVWDTHLLHDRKLVSKRALSKYKKEDLKRRYTTEEYIDNLKKIVATLNKTGAKLIWASTTPCSFYGEADDTNALVVKNNEAAKVFMKKNGIAVNDLYGYTHPHLKEWQKKDGCHFSRKGKEKLGERVASVLNDALNGKPAPADLPAFPGAEGFGAVATGGRGGRVIKVTNLKGSGPGSLQWACSREGPRIVVFDVSGLIRPSNRSRNGRWISIRQDNITIAGQTAPGAGITVEGVVSTRIADLNIPKEKRPPYSRKTKDVIIRFLRVRPTEGGDIRKKNKNVRSLEFLHCQRAIADHVSGSWGLDECFDPGYSEGDDRFTIQWCGIEESDLQLERGAEPHNFAMLSVCQHLTMHHNLFAHHAGRSPAISAYQIDFRNNVAYNVGYGYYGCRTREFKAKGQAQHNVAGNYWKAGPCGIIGARAYWPPLVRASALVNPGKKRCKTYFDGDYLDWQGYRAPISNKELVTDKPWSMPTGPTHTAEEAYELVLAHAGCLPRDTVSARTIAEVRTRTGSYGFHGPAGGLMEGLRAGEAPPDTDNDGMPDAWEKAHKLDPNDPADNNRIVPAGASPGDRHKDYTYIEYYINELADIKVAEALTRWRLDRPQTKPWDKPADQLSGFGRRHKSLEEMVAAVTKQSIEIKRKGNTQLAWLAIQQMNRMGKDAAPAVPELVKNLAKGKSDPWAVCFCAWALGAIGPAAKDAVPNLIKAFKSEQNTSHGKWDFPPYGFIAWALGRIGLTAEQVRETVPVLAKRLHGKDLSAQNNVAWVLSRVGAAAEPAMPELLRALDKDHWPHKYAGYFSARALGNIGKPAIPGLCKVFAGGDAAARANAARALGWMGADAKEAVPALIGRFKNDSSGTVRGRAAVALIEIDPTGAEVISALAEALGDKAYGVRHTVAKVLGTCGPAAKAAIPALEKALKDERKEVKRAAALALGKIGKDAVPVLEKALGTNDPFVRRYAARALGNVGDGAAGSVNDFVKALADTDAEVRREAVWSLGLIGPAAKGAAGALKKTLNDEDYVVRYAAAEALKRIQN